MNLDQRCFHAYDNETWPGTGAMMEEIIEAATKSNAHSFISQLPDG